MPGGVEDGSDERRGRSLALRSRHMNDAQLPVRIAEHPEELMHPVKPVGALVEGQGSPLEIREGSAQEKTSSGAARLPFHLPQYRCLPLHRAGLEDLVDLVGAVLARFQKPVPAASARRPARTRSNSHWSVYWGSC